MAANQTTLKLSVSGMTCGSCVRHVREALQGVDGVGEVEVNLEQGRATVGYDAASATAEQMIGAIEEAGYQASVTRERIPVGPAVRGGCGSSCCA